MWWPAGTQTHYSHATHQADCAPQTTIFDQTHSLRLRLGNNADARACVFVIILVIVLKEPNVLRNMMFDENTKHSGQNLRHCAHTLNVTRYKITTGS